MKRMFFFLLMFLSPAVFAGPTEELAKTLQSPFFTQPQSPYAVRMRAFLTDPSVSDAFKMRAYAAWTELYSLWKLEEKRDLHPKSVHASDFKEQVKKVHQALSDLIGSAGSTAGMDFWDALGRFGKTLSGPIPELDQNDSLREVLQKISAENKHGAGSQALELVVRHPITLMAQIFVVLVGYANGDLHGAMSVDAFLSMLTLTGEHLLYASDVDGWVDSKYASRFGSKMLLSQMSTAQSANGPSGLGARAQAQELQREYETQLQSLAEALTQLTSNLSLNDRANLQELHSREQEVRKLAKTIEQVEADLNERMGPTTDLVDIYYSEYLSAFLAISQKMSSAPVNPQLIDDEIRAELKSGRLNLAEAQALGSLLQKAAPESSISTHEEELRELARGSEGLRASFLKKLGQDAVSVEQDDLTILRDLQGRVSELKNQAKKSVDEVAANLQENTRLVQKREQKETTERALQESERKAQEAEQQRIAAEAAAQRAEADKRASWVRDGKLSPESITQDLDRLNETIQSQAKAVLDGIKTIRNQTGNIDYSFRIRPAQLEEGLKKPMRNLRQALSDVKERILMALNRNPQNAQDFIPAIDRFNQTIDMQYAFSDGGGFFQLPENNTAKVFNRVPEISNLKLTATDLAAITLSVVAQKTDCAGLFAQ